jgi:membrane-associated phospholipid phosphatase
VTRPIREHTFAFGLYLAAMAATLLLAESWAYGGFYAALLGTLLWLTQRSAARPTPCNLAMDHAFYPLAMNGTFQAMAVAVPAVRGVRYDDALLALDKMLLGGSANVWAERFVSAPLTELMSACYLFFMPLLFFSLVRYFFRQKELLAPFYRGLFTLYGLGFLGYLLVPAAGPYLAFPGLFDVPLEGGPITRLNQAMVFAGSNRVDVFPSLHCAVSAYILGFSWRHHRRQFFWLLLPVAGLWSSTIYLRYHYLVDVVCGFALATFCLAISRRSQVQQ